MINNVTVAKKYKGQKLINISEYNNKIIEDYKEFIIYNNKIFKNKRQSKYHQDKGHNIEIFKFKNS